MKTFAALDLNYLLLPWDTAAWPQSPVPLVSCSIADASAALEQSKPIDRGVSYEY